MKIFGIGLSRTGTTSLHYALQILGYKSVHFRLDKESQVLIASGTFELPILKNIDAILDLPVCRFYKEFDHIYPNSKFILTTREITKWSNSCEKFFKDKKLKVNLPEEGWTQYASFSTYGFNGYNKYSFEETFKTHEKNIKDYFYNRNNLLVMDITCGDGWNVLCPFLGKEAPKINFPWIKDGKNMFNKFYL